MQKTRLCSYWYQKVFHRYPNGAVTSPAYSVSKPFKVTEYGFPFWHGHQDIIIQPHKELVPSLLERHYCQMIFAHTGCTHSFQRNRGERVGTRRGIHKSGCDGEMGKMQQFIDELSRLGLRKWVVWMRMGKGRKWGGSREKDDPVQMYKKL